MTDRPVSITFDDCFERTVERVLPLLDDLDVRATFYACPNLAGEELAGMRLADWPLLEEVVARGHEIGSHTANHVALPTTLAAQFRRLAGSIRANGVGPSLPGRVVNDGYDQLRGLFSASRSEGEFDAATELDESRHSLQERLGTDVRSFAYPGGVVSTRAAKLVANSGYTSARCTTPGINTHDTDPYTLRSYPWRTFTDVEAMNALVSEGPPGWVVHTLHAVSPEPRPRYKYTTAPSELASHLRRLVDAPGVEILPVGEAVARRGRGDDTLEFCSSRSLPPGIGVFRTSHGGDQSER